jgi:hypothetical protein
MQFPVGSRATLAFNLDDSELSSEEMNRRLFLLRGRKRQMRARSGVTRPVMQRLTVPIAQHGADTIVGIDHKSVLLDTKQNYVAASLSTPTGTAPQPTIWHHGGRGYSCDGVSPYVVTDEEHKVLLAFIQSHTAMSKDDLEKAAEVYNVPRIITQLFTRHKGMFSAAIRRPGKKGNGGYYIHVKSLHNY